MLNSAEKEMYNQMFYDLVVEYLEVIKTADYARIMEYVKSKNEYYKDLSDWDISAMIDGHLNKLITDHLVEISTGKELKVLFSYVTY